MDVWGHSTRQGTRKERKCCRYTCAHPWRSVAAPPVGVCVTGVRSLVLSPLPTGSVFRLTGHPIATTLLLIHLAAFRDHIWPQELPLAFPRPVQPQIFYTATGAFGEGWLPGCPSLDSWEQPRQWPPAVW
jgi:hypothetical protein